MNFGTIIADSGVSFDNYTIGANTLSSKKCKIEYFSNKINPLWSIIILMLVIVLIIWFF